MAIIFKDSISLKVLCNIEAFLCEEGPIAEKNTKLGVFFFMFYNNLRGYPAEIFMERFFTTLFV